MAKKKYMAVLQIYVERLILFNLRNYLINTKFTDILTFGPLELASGQVVSVISIRSPEII